MVGKIAEGSIQARFRVPCFYCEQPQKAHYHPGTSEYMKKYTGCKATVT